VVVQGIREWFVAKQTDQLLKASAVAADASAHYRKM
jgi:hypothetical protein